MRSQELVLPLLIALFILGFISTLPCRPAYGASTEPAENSQSQNKRAKIPAADLSDIQVELEHAEPGNRGEEIRRVSLSEVVELAVEQNLDLALARAEEESARAGSRTAAFGLFPALEGGGGVGRTRGRVQGSFGNFRDVDYNTVDPQIAATYRVNVVSQIYEAIAARKDLDAAVYDALSTEQRLLLRTTDLYYQLALSRVGVHITERRVADGEQFVSIASAREKVGIGLGADVVRSEASLAEDRRELVQARSLWETSSARLAVVLRIDPKTLLDPDENRIQPLELLPSSAFEDVEEKARQRPEVAAFEKREVAASKRARSALWNVAAPEVNARYQETFIGEHFDDLVDGQEFGVFLGWTLSLEKLGLLSQRRTEKKIAGLRAQRAADRAAGEARIALREVEAARERLPLGKEGLDAAERNHSISLARFKGGTAIALEVLDAQDVLAKARLALARSIVDYNLAQVRLLAAVGIIQRDLLTSPAP